MASQGSSPRLRPDLTSFLGLIVGFGGITAGLILEGGNIADVAQLTGALIVLSGTIGAVMMTTPTPIFLAALRRLGLVFFEPRYSVRSIISQITEYSNRARRHGIISLDPDIELTDDPFLKKALTLAVDGTELHELRQIMELDIDISRDRGRAEAKVYEVAGGYAPTIGIIGAVLGLIQVMKNLAEIDKVGHGIAVAFVATVYGVGIANLVLLPAASKIRSRLEESVRMRELMLEGVCSIVQGVNPKMIERKLDAWVRDPEPKPRVAAMASAGRMAEGRA